jgi:ankyrin repeat protein
MSISYRGAQNLIKQGDEAGLRAALNGSLSSNLANPNGWTLLMLAAVEGHVSIGKLLLEKGARTDATNNKGQTALTIATQKGHTAFAELLAPTPPPA